jgi:hypothetical protein
MKRSLFVIIFAIGCAWFAYSEQYVYEDFSDLSRSEYMIKSDELKKHYDSIFVYYKKGDGDYIDYAYVVAEKDKIQYVLMYILPGKIFNRFKTLIVDIEEKQVAGKIVGIPMSYLQKPFSPILLIIDNKGNKKETNPFAYIKRDYTNNTVEIFEPSP